MIQRLSQTAVLTMLVACIGMAAHAESLESSTLAGNRQFDLTAQLDKTMPVKGASMNLVGAIKANVGLKLDRASSSRVGALNKGVPSPVNQNGKSGGIAPSGKKSSGDKVTAVLHAAAVGGLTALSVLGFLCLLLP